MQDAGQEGMNNQVPPQSVILTHIDLIMRIIGVCVKKKQLYFDSFAFPTEYLISGNTHYVTQVHFVLTS